MENTTQIKKSSLTFTLPNPLNGIISIREIIKSKIKGIHFSIMDGANQLGSDINNASSGSRLNRFRKFSNPIKLPHFNFNKKNLLKTAIPVLIAIVLIAGVLIATQGDSSRVAGVSTGADSKPVNSMAINREFKFPLKDEKNEKVGEFAYTIESAELRKQIIVKGQSASAVEGRIFLIINLKIVNSLDQGLSINSRDYIRISVNGNDREWFAPDIHNDPVEAQAISTKNTRVGLAINETDKNVRIQVGEIGGKKTVIPLSFDK